MNSGKILGGILLVSCTTIGGGILVLPTNTVAAGFLPTCLSLIICWLFMTYSALCMLEVTLWSKVETNLISMARSTLGWPGQLLAWITYILLLYALISAYLKACIAWISTLLSPYNGLQINNNISLPILALFMGIVIFLGTNIADLLNRLFSLFLIIAYGTLIINIPNIELQALHHTNFLNLPVIIPFITTTFGFAIIVPSLTHYLHQQTKPLVLVIVIGSLIPLIVYILWELVMLSTLYIEGPYGLSVLSKSQADGTEISNALEKVFNNPWLNVSTKSFSILAILTSLIGVCLSLFHFLADGLQLSQKSWTGIQLFLLTFIPPVLSVLLLPTGFVKIISFSSIFIAILLGLLPIMMVWSGRYYHQKISKFTLCGGKPLLMLGIVFFIYVIFQELYVILV